MKRAFPLLLVALFAMPTHAWLADGHRKATRFAIAAMQDTDLPTFFLQSAGTLAQEVVMPDALRNRATPELYVAERSEHYFDLELLDGAQLPSTRADFIAFCNEKKLRPDKVGYLPYAIIEKTQHLAIAFAHHRRQPDNKTVQARCLVIAGELAHYAQDLAQPLHVTIHFDGRDKPGSGIHKRMDALLVHGNADVDRIAPDNLSTLTMDDIAKPLFAMNLAVNKVYEVEAELPTGQPDWTPTPRVQTLADEHLKYAAQFTANCLHAAWATSATIELPDWIDQP